MQIKNNDKFNYSFDDNIGSSHLLWTGMQFGTATLENNLAISRTEKNCPEMYVQEDM